MQFLVEAVVQTTVGGLCGVVIGVLVRLHRSRPLGDDPPLELVRLRYAACRRSSTSPVDLHLRGGIDPGRDGIRTLPRLARGQARPDRGAAARITSVQSQGCRVPAHGLGDLQADPARSADKLTRRLRLGACGAFHAHGRLRAVFSRPHLPGHPGRVEQLPCNGHRLRAGAGQGGKPCLIGRDRRGRFNEGVAEGFGSP